MLYAGLGSLVRAASADEGTGNDSFTKLLLHGDGTGGSQVFTDSSASAHTVSFSGSSGYPQLDTGTKKFGTASIALASNFASNLQLDGSDDFAFGTGAFTIDFWINYQGNNTGTYIIYDGIGFGGSSGAYPRLYLVDKKLRFKSDPVEAIRITGTTALTAGTWAHVALARSGTSTKLFLNGTQEGSTYSDSNNYAIAGSRPIIGIDGTDETSTPLDAFIDEFRISKGVARWTANFTPPTSAYS